MAENFKPCSVEGCNRSSDAHSFGRKGYCSLHYRRVRLYGNPTTNNRRTPNICCVEGCGKRCHGHGYCAAHWERWRRYGDPLAGRTPVGEAMDFLTNIVIRHEGEECLTWPYSKDSNGYGKISLDGRMQPVHRIVCEAIHGAPPTTEHQAAHSCGKGHLACVSPNHLNWKTPKGNCADMLAHGTRLRGTKHNMAKIDDRHVHAARILRGKMKQRDIAAILGISQANVCLIQKGKTWGFVTDTPD